MRPKILALLYFISITLVVTWPLALHLDSYIIDRVDGLLITWFLNWDIHALGFGISGLSQFYNANIFYPYQNTLAFSEIMLPQAILAAPFVSIFKEPLLAYNFNFLLGFILTGYAVYWLALFLTRRQPVAIFAGTLFSFSSE